MHWSEPRPDLHRSRRMDSMATSYTGPDSPASGHECQVGGKCPEIWCPETPTGALASRCQAYPTRGYWSTRCASCRLNIAHQTHSLAQPTIGLSIIIPPNYSPNYFADEITQCVYLLWITLTDENHSWKYDPLKLHSTTLSSTYLYCLWILLSIQERCSLILREKHTHPRVLGKCLVCMSLF